MFAGHTGLGDEMTKRSMSPSVMTASAAQRWKQAITAADIAALYPAAGWTLEMFDGWTDQAGPFQMWQDEHGKIWAETIGGVACPEVIPVRIDDTGRIYGFYGLEGLCHVGWLSQGVCVPATLDTTFSEFHSRDIVLDTGDTLRVGFGTAVEDHTDELDGAEALAAQVDVSQLVAVVRATYYPGVGIWFAGQIIPGTDPVLVEQMRLGYPSGHWAGETSYDLRLVHWVTKPGFPPDWYVPEGGRIAATAVDNGTVPSGTTNQRSAVVATRTFSTRIAPKQPVAASYKVVDAPPFRWESRLDLGDGNFGRYSQTVYDADGNQFVIVIVQEGNEFADTSTVYPVGDVSDTGQAYEWVYDEEEDVIVASRGAVKASCCGGCAKKAADTTDSMDTTDSSGSTVTVEDLDAVKVRLADIETRLDALETPDSTDPADSTDSTDSVTAGAAPRFSPDAVAHLTRSAS